MPATDFTHVHIHIKPTNTGLYTFWTFYRKHIKLTYLCLQQRSHGICSSWLFFDNEINYLIKKFLSLDYPESLLLKMVKIFNVKKLNDDDKK